MDLSKHLEENYPDLCTPSVLASINKTRTMNSLDNKQLARVFGLYIGQKCGVKGTTLDKVITGVNEQSANIRSTSWESKGHPSRSWDFNEIHISLKSLSAISDEDAIEVARIVLPKEPPHNQTAYIGKKILRVHGFAWKVNTEILFQFLIQQGYAVPLYHGPNHPDNGKTAIESGLALDSTLLPDQKGEEG